MGLRGLLSVVLTHARGQLGLIQSYYQPLWTVSLPMNTSKKIAYSWRNNGSLTHVVGISTLGQS